MEKFNTNIPVRYGIIALLVSIVSSMIFYFFYQTLFGSFFMSAVVGLLSFGIAAFIGIWSGITYRRDHGNVISFGHAFLAIFIVYAFSTGGSIVSNYLINDLIDPQYAENASSYMKSKMEEQFEKMNMTDEQIKEATKDMNAENFNPPPLKFAKKMGGFLAFMAFVALIAAAFIKRNSNDLIKVE